MLVAACEGVLGDRRHVGWRNTSLAGDWLPSSPVEQR